MTIHDDVFLIMVRYSNLQDDFIASVLNSGILVYLTPEFLAELYQGILVSDVIGNAGFNVNVDSNAPMSSCAFINLLTGTEYLCIYTV